MIEAHCITLMDEQKRLEHVQKEAAKWGDGFHIRTAIDGRKVSVHPFEDVPPGWSTLEARKLATYVGLFEEEMTDAKRACAKGHVSLALEWLERVESKEVTERDYMLILEDDFAWKNLPQFKLFLSQLEQQARPEFDMILVGYRGGEKRHLKADWHRWCYTQRSRKTADPAESARLLLESRRWPGRKKGPLHLRSAGHHLGMHGYLINAAAARGMVHVGSSLAYPADFLARMMEAFQFARVGITPQKWVITRTELGSTLRDEAEFLESAVRFPTD